MKCTEFEARINDYIDQSLERSASARFREHTLICPGCRALLNEISGAIDDCKYASIEPPDSLAGKLALIPEVHTPLDCGAFQELITEFLDGFVPATTYTRFAEHAAACSECSDLLTEVVFAVAACHGVHVYADLPVPESLLGKLAAISPPRKLRLSRAVSGRMRSIAERLLPLPAAAAQRSFAMGLSLALLTIASLLLGFSDDGTVGGIYRQAEFRASELYSRGHTEKERVVADLKEVQADFGEVWGALGGNEQGVKAAPPGKSSDGK
jgi:hypothetical protein